MQRTQVQLTEKQHARLRRLSHATGKSLAALVRAAVDDMLARMEDPKARLRGLAGAFVADRTDVAEHHDDYFPVATKPRGRK